jgi:hypothetical protein
MRNHFSLRKNGFIFRKNHISFRRKRLFHRKMAFSGISKPETGQNCRFASGGLRIGLDAGSKAAEGRRSPRRWRVQANARSREASWSAPVLWRFGKMSLLTELEMLGTGFLKRWRADGASENSPAIHGWVRRHTK